MSFFAQRKPIILALLAFGFIQLLWYLSKEASSSNEAPKPINCPKPSPPSPCPACPSCPKCPVPPIQQRQCGQNTELTPGFRHFAMGQATSANIHVVCEIGHDDRLGPAFWLDNPLLSVVRFGDEFVRDTIPPVENYTIRVRYFEDAEAELAKRRSIFHCDLISITNATRLPDEKVVSLVRTLSQWADWQTSVVLLGACPDCSDHGRAQMKAWKALNDAHLVSPLFCSPSLGVEDWCLGKVRHNNDVGKYRPAIIPRLEPTIAMELRERAAKMNGTILFTTVTNGFKDYVLNYECSLRRIGLDSVLYQPMDLDSVRLLEGVNAEYEKKGIPRRVLASYDPQLLTNTSRTMTYKEQVFIQVMRGRFALQAELLLMGFNVFLCDADVAFNLNPMPYFSYDVTLQGQPDEFDFEELYETKKQIQINGGFYLTLATNEGLLWMASMRDIWIAGTARDAGYDDQNAVVDTAAKIGCFTQYPNMAVYGCPVEQNRKATFKFLDPANFPTGHLSSSEQKLAYLKTKHTPARPLVGLHANSHSKRYRFGIFNVWFLTESVADESCNLRL